MAENSNRNPVRQVDLREVFHEKNPRLAKFLPGFVYRYLRRIIHEDDVNEILRNYGHLRDLEFAEACLKDFNVSLEIHGLKKIDPEKKYIIVANHPLGGFDGIVLMKVVGEYFGDLKFLVNDILMNVRNFEGLFIPINKHGKQGFESARQIEQAFESDRQILSFPAGLVSRRIKGRIVDLDWHKNFISKAREYKRDVIPVHFSGRNSNFFYRLASIRKFLGIRANLEMLYLVDETFKHRNKHIVLRFGTPIPWVTFDKTRRPAEWARWVKDQVYELAGTDQQFN